MSRTLSDPPGQESGGCPYTVTHDRLYCRRPTDPGRSPEVLLTYRHYQSRPVRGSRALHMNPLLSRHGRSVRTGVQGPPHKPVTDTTRPTPLWDLGTTSRTHRRRHHSSVSFTHTFTRRHDDEPSRRRCLSVKSPGPPPYTKSGTTTADTIVVPFGHTFMRLHRNEDPHPPLTITTCESGGHRRRHPSQSQTRVSDTLPRDDDTSLIPTTVIIRRVHPPRI